MRAAIALESAATRVLHHSWRSRPSSATFVKKRGLPERTLL